VARRTPEGYVKDMIEKKFKAAFPDAYRFMPVQSGYGRNGVPDYLFCIRGLFIGVEAKAPGGVPTGLQLNEMRMIRRSGGYATVVENEAECNQCIEEVRAILETLDLN
jgi:hypothetical protein